MPQEIRIKSMCFRENRWGGLVSQGLGTSMLQMPNIVRNPRVWIAPTLASAITGPIATCVFKLEMNGAPINSGMGTSGLCGQIGLITGWAAPMCEENAALGVDFAAATASPALNWIGLVVCSFVIPALVSWLVSELMRKKGLIKEGYDADLVIFDYDKLQDTATYSNSNSITEGIDSIRTSSSPVLLRARCCATTHKYVFPPNKIYDRKGNDHVSIDRVFDRLRAPAHCAHQA